MAQVESSTKPETVNCDDKPAPEKRKLDVDSDDELFFAYESSSKMKKTDDGVETKTTVKTPKPEAAPKQEETNKENKLPPTAVNLAQKLISPKPNQPAAVDSPKTNKSLIQKKLPFSPTTKSTSETKSTPVKPVVRENGEWFIEDYLTDEQWKKWLADEFEKPYFKEINAFIKEGYKKNMVRPPKELVFNALNSTRLDKIKVVILGQDPYHDDGQVFNLCFDISTNSRSI